MLEKIKLNECPVCGYEHNRQVLKLEVGNLSQCKRCSLTFHLPRPSLLELEKYYISQEHHQSYELSDMVGSKFAENRYSQFSRQINRYSSGLMHRQNRRLLDLGCGTGDFLYIASQHNWQVSGQDISPLAARQANQNIGMNCVQSGNMENIELETSSYDVVTSYHVIEHLLDPLLLLQQAYKYLKPGGVIFIETPNIESVGAKLRGKNWSQIIPVEHINYFSTKSIKFALRKAGFGAVQAYTICPQKIQSLDRSSLIIRLVLASAYRVAPFINMGATLQAVATKTLN